MSIQWMTYQGKQILYVDYQNLTGPELIQTLEAAYQNVMDAPGKVLVLNNFTGARLDAAFMARAKDLGQPKGERKAARMAAIGTGGLKMILMQAYNKATSAGMMPFDTENEALEWLVSAET